jgi:tight adherence protein B
MSTYTVAAAVLAGVTVLAWLGPPPHLLLARLDEAGRQPQRPSRVRHAAARVLRRWQAGIRARLSMAAASILAATVAGAATAGWAGALRGLLAAEVAIVGTQAASRAIEARAGQRRDEQWREACEVLSAELRAGRTAEEAVTLAARGCADLVPVVNTMRMGGDVAAALRAVPDAPAAAGLASAWATAHASGAGLAGVVERVVAELAERLELRHEVAAQLAAPRATARLLALLPLGGMGLGVMLGVDPVSMLLGSTLGLCCLLAGSLLALAGVVWVDRLARRAQVS